MKLKKLIIWCCVAGVAYFLVAHHFVFFGTKVRVLKKSTLTLEDTLVSTQGKTNEALLLNAPLRKAGIGQVLVQMGRISGDDLETLTDKIEAQEEENKAKAATR